MGRLLAWCGCVCVCGATCRSCCHARRLRLDNVVSIGCGLGPRRIGAYNVGACVCKPWQQRSRLRLTVRG